MQKPQPPLDEFHWEDVVFVPARPSRPKIERVRASLDTVRVQLTMTLAIVAALSLMTMLETQRAGPQLAYRAGANGPETTGSITRALRPTLPE